MMTEELTDISIFKYLLGDQRIQRQYRGSLTSESCENTTIDQCLNVWQTHVSIDTWSIDRLTGVLPIINLQA